MSARHTDVPSAIDPISEPTLNRRVWGLYLNRGYDRAKWARAMEVSYSVACRWDNGGIQMSAANLARAAQVLAVSADDLLFGRGGRPQPDVAIDHLLVRAALDAVDAQPESRARFAAHVDSPEGRYQVITPHYVHRWVQTYETELRAGTRADQAAARAFAEAVNARAAVAAAATSSGADGGGTASQRKPRKPRARLPITVSRAH